jgi:hypothetical protein
MGRKQSGNYLWGLEARGQHLKIDYHEFIDEGIFYVKAVVNGLESFLGRSSDSYGLAKLKCAKKIYISHCARSQWDWSSDEDDSEEFTAHPLSKDLAFTKYQGNYILAVDEVTDHLGLDIVYHTDHDGEEYHLTAKINGDPSLYLVTDESKLQAELKLAKLLWIRYFRDKLGVSK